MMLELRNICKTYLQGRLEVPVLKGISLSVEEGEYLAIMGPSGSGKTTLMNIIGCLDNPTSGEYLLGDEDIARVSEKRMSEVRLHSIGFVFQSFYLLSRQSALENVALPLLYAGVRRRERQEVARRALERVGLGDRTDFKPTQLSGGQCQRVAIARAIVNNPKIILADEPTGALDTKSGQQIMEIFQSLNDEGATIVMITHEPEIAAHAKRTLHIRDGLLLGGAGQPLPEPPSPTEGEEGRTPPPPPISAGSQPLSAIPDLAAGQAGTGPALQRAQAGASPQTGKGTASPVSDGQRAQADPAPHRAALTADRAANPLYSGAQAGASPDNPAPHGPTTGTSAGRSSGQNVYGRIPAPQRQAPTPKRTPPVQDSPRQEEEPLSGKSIIAALERQLDELKQENAPGREEGSAHE